MKLFDSEGVALLQTMQGGSEAMRAMRGEADRLGLTLDQGTADAAARAKDSMSKLGKASEAAGIVLINALGPAIESVANWLQSDLPSAAQFAIDAFNELQQFIANTGNFVTGALAGVEFALSDAASAVGADQLARALRKAGEDYADAANNFDRVVVRLKKAKLELPTLGGEIGGPGKFSDIYNQGIADSYTPGGSGKKKSGLSEAQKELNKVMEEGARLTESLLTPQEAYAAQIESLNRLREAGAVSQETYNRAVADYQDKLDQASGVTAQFAELQKVIAEVDPVAPLLDQLGVLEDLIAAYPEYGDIITEQMLRVQEEIDKANDGLKEQKDDVEKTKSAWEELGPTFSSAFEDAIVEGKKLSDVMNGLEKDILRIVTRKLVTEPLGNAISGIFGGGGSGLLGGVGKLFGFATGGSFTVGGSGGTDSQLVAFRATPNERVDVLTPAQQSGRMGNTYNFTFALPSGSIDHRRTGEQVAREAARRMQLAQGAV